MKSETLTAWHREMNDHLENELLPFWLERCWDNENGGYLTQFDTDGRDTGVNEKSLLAHMRMIYSLTIAHEYGHDPSGQCAELALRGMNFAVDNYWDNEEQGFYWLFDRKNRVVTDKKIVYGHSFAIYALSTFARVFRNYRALEYAEKCFDLLQKYAAETSWGGYLEMFESDWELCGPGSGGGDRKTLDVHMHLMEAFTALYAASGKHIHRRKLLEVIELLTGKIMHPDFGTGIPQFYRDWKVAPQIKFDIVWGWDRFEDGEKSKPNALDNTSYGHNVEFFWLLNEALEVLGADSTEFESLFQKILSHSVGHGVDHEYGGVYVEGSHNGSEVYDTAKEFWQQAEFLIGMLTAFLLYRDEKYLDIYGNVHRFLMDKGIKHETGEWWPLLTREGVPIWTHMSHSWKINYHSVRSAVFSVERLSKVISLFSEDKQ